MDETPDFADGALNLDGGGEKKFILDACCSNRQMWFNKQHPNTIYIDNRKEPKGFISFSPNVDIQPDKIMDFRDLKFDNKSFKLIAWDPPHIVSNCKTGAIVKKYGALNPLTWEADLKQGFNELWRVLDDYGLLIFKWSICKIPIKNILALFHTQPLFGHTTGSKNTTRWMTFMKIPEESHDKPR